MTRRPAPWGTFAAVAAAFLVVFGFLAMQIRAGHDPAIGAGRPEAASVAERPVVVRRILERRVVRRHRAAPAGGDGGAIAPAAATAGGGGAAIAPAAAPADQAPSAAPAPAPAPAPAVSSAS